MKIYRAVGIVHLKVYNGNLMLSEKWMNKYNRETIFEASNPDIDHIVLCTWGGSITLEVYDWLTTHNVALTIVDEHGNVHAEHIPPKFISAVTKSKQILLSENKKLELASTLILQKIKGQQDNLNWAYENNLMKQPVQLDTNFGGTSIDELRIFEAVQSKTYWGNLAEIQMKFNRPKKVPTSEWHFVGSRTSVKTNSPKKAITPFHAILNYIYTLTSTRIKRCLVDYRVDPSLPIMHSLNAYRSSLVYDLIEPIRPMIDQKLLSSLQKDNSLYARVEHFLYSDGVCLLDPDYANVWHKRILTKELDKRIETIVQGYVQNIK